MSSKNSRVKIHVGRNQKFTAKNSWAKNSHGRQGLFPWACPWVVGRFSTSQNLCKVTKNKRPPQQANIFFLLFLLSIVI